MRTSRLALNLAAIAAVSSVLLIYAVTDLLVGKLTGVGYPVEVVLADSGGLLAGQEVTVSGRVVGTVQDVRLEGEGVVAELAIDDGERVPVDSDVTVLRRSPIGEQALNFRPRTPSGRAVGPGERIVALDAVTPVPVQRLLEKASEVFEPVDGERAGALVHELAETVRGRKDDIRALIRDGGRLSAALAGNADDIERFFAHGATMNEALARSRESLARSIGQMADAAGSLVEMRADFEGLLREAPPVLGQVESLLARNQGNLDCALTAFGNFNDYLGQPEQLRNGEQTLRLNQWFFEGFRLGGPRDPEGRVWTRIKFLPPQPEQPVSYLPDKRPIPEIRPGGACASPLGGGASAASQPGFEPLSAESEVDWPEGGGSSQASAVPASATSGMESLVLLALAGAGVPAAAALRHRLRGRHAGRTGRT